MKFLSTTIAAIMMMVFVPACGKKNKQASYHQQNAHVDSDETISEDLTSHISYGIGISDTRARQAIKITDLSQLPTEALYELVVEGGWKVKKVKKSRRVTTSPYSQGQKDDLFLFTKIKYNKPSEVDQTTDIFKSCQPQADRRAVRYSSGIFHERDEDTSKFFVSASEESLDKLKRMRSGIERKLNSVLTTYSFSMSDSKPFNNINEWLRRVGSLNKNEDYNVLLSHKQITSNSNHALPCFNYLVSTYANGVYADGRSVSKSATTGSLEFRGDQIKAAMAATGAYLDVYLDSDLQIRGSDDENDTELYLLQGEAIKDFLITDFIAQTHTQVFTAEGDVTASLIPTGSSLRAHVAELPNLAEPN